MKKNNKKYALKEMSKVRIIDRRSEKSIRGERDFLSKLRHPFIVNMNCAFQDYENLYLVMDLLTGGDLRYHLCKLRKFSEEETKFFISCTLLGLEYIHNNNIIHRDIKPENLVCDENGYIRITDFGVAKIKKEDNSSETSGTPGYMAPEVIMGQNHSFTVDFFAIGIMGYEFMFGQRPYPGKNRKEVKHNILKKQAKIDEDDVPDGWSMESVDFINKCLKRKESKRLGFKHGVKELKNHCWFVDFDWDSLYKKNMGAPFVPKKSSNFDKKYCEGIEKISEETIERYQSYMSKKNFKNVFYGYTFISNELLMMSSSINDSNARTTTTNSKKGKVSVSVNKEQNGVLAININNDNNNKNILFNDNKNNDNKMLINGNNKGKKILVNDNSNNNDVLINDNKINKNMLVNDNSNENNKLINDNKNIIDKENNNSNIKNMSANIIEDNKENKNKFDIMSFLLEQKLNKQNNNINNIEKINNNNIEKNIKEKSNLNNNINNPIPSLQKYLSHSRTQRLLAGNHDAFYSLNYKNIYNESYLSGLENSTSIYNANNINGNNNCNKQNNFDKKEFSKINNGSEFDLSMNDKSKLNNEKKEFSHKIKDRTLDMNKINSLYNLCNMNGSLSSKNHDKINLKSNFKQSLMAIVSPANSPKNNKNKNDDFKNNFINSPKIKYIYGGDPSKKIPFCLPNLIKLGGNNTNFITGLKFNKKFDNLNQLKLKLKNKDIKYKKINGNKTNNLEKKRSNSTAIIENNNYLQNCKSNNNTSRTKGKNNNDDHSRNKRDFLHSALRHFNSYEHVKKKYHNKSDFLG